VRPVQDLFLWAITQEEQCNLEITMNMLVALKKLQVELTSDEQNACWKQVNMRLQGATPGDVINFCKAAQALDLHLRYRFASTVTNILGKELAKDITPDEAKEIRLAVRSLKVCQASSKTYACS
jgi:hypothetical protein